MSSKHHDSAIYRQTSKNVLNIKSHNLMYRNIHLIRPYVTKSFQLLQNQYKFSIIVFTRKTPGFARLCSRSRFRFVGVLRLSLRNWFCLDFTYGVHCTADAQSGQDSSRLHQRHLVAKTGVLCYKTFAVRKSRISPQIPDFSGFFFNLSLF